jgi:hypothetical protein
MYPRFSKPYDADSDTITRTKRSCHATAAVPVFNTSGCALEINSISVTEKLGE